MKKLDLVLWAKNGEDTLPLVLGRINKTIPRKSVGNKLVVDDDSIDQTRQIAEKYGWNVVANEGSGISDAANTALKHVETPFFASFEQDLLLSHSWWSKISKLFTDNKVVGASGVRFSNQPPYIKSLQKYVYSKYLGTSELPAWLRHRQMAAFTLGKTLDNTLWRTSFMQKQGFPKTCSNAGFDNILAYQIHAEGYKWIVDYNVQSTHLRDNSFRQELRRQCWYASAVQEVWNEIKQRTDMAPPVTFLGLLTRTLYSPLTGALCAWKTRQPLLFFVHPLIRLFYLKGYFEGAKFG